MFKALKFNLPWKRKDKKIKKIILGICAMDKKARSKPMREIIERLPDEIFEIVYFGDECILNEPIESWPVVEVLIAFYSTRFPTNKALQYVKLRKPFLINDLTMEETLKDRRKVYDILESIGIDVPFHVFVNRANGAEDTNEIEEFDEYIVVNGIQINKPLVEKPVDAEDHNIYIYYPMHAGGGSKRLFRKVDDRSSEFYPTINEIRRQGSYIYEEFVLTHGTDVKVYTVGPDYGHAEARKSPVVDGRVKRDSNGREVRFPVILSPQEKEMARKIVRAFRQTVCGFDILRVQGRSYCCDVNGFSFVKNSRKYYDDASQILTEMMVNAVRPEYKSPYSPQVPLLRTIPVTATSSAAKPRPPRKDVPASPNPDSSQFVLLEGSGKFIHSSSTANSIVDANEDRSPSPSGQTDDANVTAIPSSVYYNQSQSRYEQEELRGVIAIIRHGDRTPKQKIKLVVSEPRFLDYFHSYVKTPIKELKVKSKSGLLRFLEVTRDVIQEKSIAPELRRKLNQIRDVLERWEISGINRKLQMKPLKWEDDNSLNDEPVTPNEDLRPSESCVDFMTLPDLAASDKCAPGNVAIFEKEKESKEAKDKESGKEGGKEKKKYGLATEILIILKWGGDLTPLGREQAENLGAQFRTEHYPESDNGGVLRLHATYRHDLKIKASDEGRVIKTAAAFTKGLLALEGQLTPIISSLVTMEEKNRQMLDRGGNFEMKEEMDRCKNHLNLLQVDKELDDHDIDKVAPQCAPAMRKAFFELGNPLQQMKRMHYLIGRLTTQLEMICAQQYAYYEAQEAQLLLQQQAQAQAQAQLPSDSSASLVGLSMGHGGSQDTIDIPAGTRDRTASNCSQVGAGSSTASSPRPTLMTNNSNIQYIELGAPDNLSPVAQSASGFSAVGSSTLEMSDMNIFPSSSSLADPMDVNHLNSIDIHSSPNSTNPQDVAGAGGPTTLPPMDLYLQETCDLMWDRWDKLYRDFYSTKHNQYDLTKVPDVFDMIRYDLIHNSTLQLSGMEELFQIASKFERCVVPQEYGTDKEDKRYIGSKMCGALLEKIKHDLTIASADNALTSDPMLYQLDQSHAEDLRINSFTRCVRTRLYFTSESHLHTVLNILRFAKPGSAFALSKDSLDVLEQITDVSYLSQIIIRLFQDRTDNSKYRCEIAFSSGTSTDVLSDKAHSIAPYLVIERSVNLTQLMGLLDESIDLYRSSREERMAEEELANDASGLEAAQEQMQMQEAAEAEAAAVAAAAAAIGAGVLSPEGKEAAAAPGASPHAASPMATASPGQHLSPAAGHSPSGAPSLSPPGHGHVHLQHHHPYQLPPHVRRGGGSITVNMDELNSLTNDRWETAAVPHSNTHTFVSRAHSLGTGGLRVPRPIAMRPVLLDDDDTGKVHFNNFTAAYRARRGYAAGTNPQLKAIADNIVRKGSPSTSATSKAAGLAASGDPTLRSFDALSLQSSGPAGASPMYKSEQRKPKTSAAAVMVPSTVTTAVGDPSPTAALTPVAINLERELDKEHRRDRDRDASDSPVVQEPVVRTVTVREVDADSNTSSVIHHAVYTIATPPLLAMESVVFSSIPINRSPNRSPSPIPDLPPAQAAPAAVSGPPSPVAAPSPAPAPTTIPFQLPARAPSPGPSPGPMPALDPSADQP